MFFKSSIGFVIINQAWINVIAKEQFLIIIDNIYFSLFFSLFDNQTFFSETKRFHVFKFYILFVLEHALLPSAMKIYLIDIFLPTDYEQFMVLMDAFDSRIVVDQLGLPYVCLVLDIYFD